MFGTGIDYSICITHRNNIATIERSLASIFDQIDDTFEVIVVDSDSTDGSLDILRRHEADGKIMLVVTKCSRGKGRQIAFEHSRGRCVISNLDMDEVYAPKLRELLNFYEMHAAGKLLLATSSLELAPKETQFITIGTREIIEEIGGWRDLNHTEDWEMWRKAANVRKFAHTGFRLVMNVNYHPEHRKFWAKLKLRYQRYSEMIRINQYVFKEEKRISLAQRGMYILAKIGTLGSHHFDRDQDPMFSPYDSRYSIEMK